MNWLSALYTIAVTFDQPVIKNREARRLLLLPVIGSPTFPRGKVNKRDALRNDKAVRRCADKTPFHRSVGGR